MMAYLRIVSPENGQITNKMAKRKALLFSEVGLSHTSKLKEDILSRFFSI